MSGKSPRPLPGEPGAVSAGASTPAAASGGGPLPPTSFWMAVPGGTVFALGDAAFYGSTGGQSTEPAAKIVAAEGGGCGIVDQNGTEYPFGTSSPPPTQGVLFQARTPGDAAVAFVLLQLNEPYVWGGNGPAGYDCSGLALASWAQAEGIGFARVADDQYHTARTAVPLDELVAGDLVLWGTDQSNWTTVYHTGIDIGGDQTVQATGDHVQLDTLGGYSATGDLMPVGRQP